MRRQRSFLIWVFLNLFLICIRDATSTQTGSSIQTSGTGGNLSCMSTKGTQYSLSGRQFPSKSTDSSGGNGGASASNSPSGSNGRASVIIFQRLPESDTDLINVTLDDNQKCATTEIVKPGVADDKKTCILFGSVLRNDDGKCVRNLWDLVASSISSRSNPCILVVFTKKDEGNVAPRASGQADNPNPYLFIVDGSNADVDARSTITQCSLPNRQLEDDQNQQDSLLNNFSRTSVLFVSVSFIILMVISLAWLVFYYVQRFRYAHAKDRLARRLFNAAKKALTKIPAKSLRQGDKELDSDCPVCIEPYHAGDVIRILPCKHVFHKTCVDPWLLEHRTCPMCKMDILKAFGYHFGHSEESVRDVDQLSAGGQSTDGGSGTGTGGRSASVGQHGFPMSLQTDSDLHDPFFPSPIPSPSLLQPVLHSSNAQTFTIIPLTVHRHHGGGPSTFGGGRGSDSSADSGDNWVTGGAIQRQHSAEVHHGAGIGSIPDADSPNKATDDNHNDTSTVHRPQAAHHHRRHYRPREITSAKPSNVSTISSSSSASSSGKHQQRQPLFHSRSAVVLRGSGPGNSGDSCESDDGVPTPVEEARKHSMASGKRAKQDIPNQPNQRKFSAIVSRGRSTSQTASSSANKARMTVSSTPPPTAAGRSTTTTSVVGRASTSSLSSGGSDCVVVGVLNSTSTGRIAGAAKGKKSTRNAASEQPKGSASLESL